MEKVRGRWGEDYESIWREEDQGVHSSARINAERCLLMASLEP